MHGNVSVNGVEAIECIMTSIARRFEFIIENASDFIQNSSAASQLLTQLTRF